MSTRIPSRGSDQFNLRLPDGMRGRLKVAAEEAGRSMNAEIIDRLERSFELGGAHGVSEFALDEIVRQAVATSLYQVTRSMAAIVESGKESTESGRPVDYVGMVRQMADEFRENYEEEIGPVDGAKPKKRKGRALDLSHKNDWPEGTD